MILAFGYDSTLLPDQCFESWDEVGNALTIWNWIEFNWICVNVSVAINGVTRETVLWKASPIICMPSSVKSPPFKCFTHKLCLTIGA